MKRLPMIVAVFVMVTAVPAMAVNRTGNDLLVDCGNLISTESIESVSKEKLLGIGYCIGLIDGLVTFNYVYEAVLEGEGNSNMVQMCLPRAYFDEAVSRGHCQISSRQPQSVAGIRSSVGGPSAGYCLPLRPGDGKMKPAVVTVAGGDR